MPAMVQLVADGDPVMNVDCMDLQSYDPTVYQQLVSYPAEVMTIMDTEAQKLARTFQPEDEPMGDDMEGGAGLAVLVGCTSACTVVSCNSMQGSCHQLSDAQQSPCVHDRFGMSQVHAS